MGRAVLVPTFEVRRTKPFLVSVTVEATNELAALRDAQRICGGDAYDTDAYEATRQPPEPDDNGDVRSEARYALNDTDTEREHREDHRWSLGSEEA